MVLDEDALEAMLKRQNRDNRGPVEPSKVTHETEDFAVYERPQKAAEEPAPEPAAPIEPAPFEEVDEELFEEITPEPTQAFQEMEPVEPAPVVPEPAPQQEYAPAPEAIPDFPTFTSRSHAPEPTPAAEPAREPTRHERPPTPSWTPAAATAPQKPAGPRVAIIQALFNQELTDMMTQLATAKANKLGAEVVAQITVPGVFDLPLATLNMLRRDDVDCAVVIGVVVQGETKHDELITHATAQSIQQITLETGKPIGFGVTGPGMTWAQAEARVSNGAHAMEAAVAQCTVLA